VGLDEHPARAIALRHGRWPIHALWISVLGIALALRVLLATTVQHPGRADHAFYYTVAENLVDGRGFVIDYIWNYLGHPATITHSSNDYWMPLTSAIISLPLFLFGKSLFAALVPSMIAGIVISGVTFCFSRLYSTSLLVALGSAFLVLFAPSLFQYSLLTDSSIYYALLASSSLVCMIRGSTNPRFFLVSAGLAGLAHLTRQDGLLLVPVLISTILWFHGEIRTKILYVALSLILYALVLSPLMISNYATLGTPFASGPSKTMFLTQYEDLYSYSKELSLRSYLASGFTTLALAKARMALSNLKTLCDALGFVLSCFALVGALGLVRSRREGPRLRASLPPLLFLGILFLFYTLVATVPSSQGGFLRSSLAAVPFLIVIAVDAFHRAIPSRTAVGLGLLVILSMFLYESVTKTRALIDSNTRLGQELSALEEVVTSDARAQGYDEVVIMTRNPWEVSYSTGYKAVQIPNESLETIYRVAQEYGAIYLLPSAKREALRSLGTTADRRFEFVADIPASSLKLFRIRPSARP